MKVCEIEKQLLNEIAEGIYKRRNVLCEDRYCLDKGIGSKSYITKRIDILREKLLEIKKEVKEDKI